LNSVNEFSLPSSVVIFHKFSKSVNECALKKSTHFRRSRQLNTGCDILISAEEDKELYSLLIDPWQRLNEGAS